MKNILSILAILAFAAGCINSSTSFSNRGVTYQVTPELLGDQAYVADSPSAHDTSLEADKTLDAKTNASGTGTVTDNSSNEQNEKTAPEEEEPKTEEAPAEAPSEEVQAEG